MPLTLQRQPGGEGIPESRTQEPTRAARGTEGTEAGDSVNEGIDQLINQLMNQQTEQTWAPAPTEAKARAPRTQKQT